MMLLFLLAALAHPPYNIAADKDGNLYVLDWAKKRVLKITPEGKSSEFASFEKRTNEHPHALAIDGDGNLYVAATYAAKIWKVSPKGEVSDHYPGTIKALPSGNVLNLAWAPSGKLFLILHEHDVDDRGVHSNHRYRLVSVAAGGKVEEIFHRKEKDEGYLDLYGGSMVVAKNDTVVLSRGSKLYTVGKEGKVTELAKDFGAAYGMAVDAEGNVLVADLNNHRLRKVTLAGEVTTVAGTGKAGGKDGAVGEATLDGPYAVAVSGDAVYVAEYAQIKGDGAHRVRRIAKGQVTTLATVSQE